jgi:site-specific recombinase XerD
MAAFPAPDTGVARADQLVLRAAVSAYLGRYRGETRLHTESDLRAFLRWCTDQDLDPLAALRADIERYVCWLQDVRRYQPSRSPAGCRSWWASTASALSTLSTKSWRTRRPTTSAGPRCRRSRPLWVSGHLQFEALITTARLSANSNGFALVALLGLLGLRIFEACGVSIADLGEEHGHRVLRVRGKGGKIVLVPLPPAVAHPNYILAAYMASGT